jgi:phosphoribosylanthranilate isomerase
VNGSSVRIKICGLTQVDEALECLDAGADLVGLNFHTRSSRFVEVKRAAEILSALSMPAQAVGLFVDRPPAEIAGVARKLGLSIVQLHGSEPPGDLSSLAEFMIIRAFRLGSAADVERMTDYLKQAAEIGRSPNAILVDSQVPGLQGGTGTLLNSEVLKLVPPLSNLILAGGLTPENVAERIRLVRPWMVDVASGVESSPGRKDPARVRAFIEAVRSSQAV